MAVDPDKARGESGESGDPQARLSESDLDLIRVIEDLVDLLVAKNVITITDLPESAREKLFARRRLRMKVSRLANLVASEDDTV